MTNWVVVLSDSGSAAAGSLWLATTRSLSSHRRHHPELFGLHISRDGHANSKRKAVGKTEGIPTMEGNKGVQISTVSRAPSQLTAPGRRNRRRGKQSTSASVGAGSMAVALAGAGPWHTGHRQGTAQLP